MNDSLIDTHCHLYFSDYDKDLEQVLENASEAGINRIMIPGIDLKTSQQALALSEKTDWLFAAVGFHPNDSKTWATNSRENLKTLTGHPKVRAIGEIGLDFYWDHSPPETQIKVLKEQLLIAEEVNKPVILHSREAFSALWQVIKEWHEDLVAANHPLAEMPGVFHAFSEGIEQYREISTHNFFIGLGGPVTFKNAKKLQAFVGQINLDRVLLETDCPFLTPHPFRGKRNEPQHIRLIAKKIAEIKNLSLKEVALQTSDNAAKLFKWRTNI